MDEVDHPLHRFALIDGISNNALELRAQTHRLLGFLGRNAVTRVRVFLEQHHIISDDFRAEIDESCSMLGNL